MTRSREELEKLFREEEDEMEELNNKIDNRIAFIKQFLSEDNQELLDDVAHWFDQYTLAAATKVGLLREQIEGFTGETTEEQVALADE